MSSGGGGLKSFKTLAKWAFGLMQFKKCLNKYP